MFLRAKRKLAEKEELINSGGKIERKNSRDKKNNEKRDSKNKEDAKRRKVSSLFKKHILREIKAQYCTDSSIKLRY